MLGDSVACRLHPRCWLPLPAALTRAGMVLARRLPRHTEGLAENRPAPGRGCPSPFPADQTWSSAKRAQSRADSPPGRR